MKKLLITIFTLLIITNLAHAKLSEAFWTEVFNGCYLNSDKTKAHKLYCACYTDKFDAKFSDEELIDFLNTAGELSDNYLVKRYSRECIDKHIK